jgi:glutamate-1-semialdehyde aminotransferase/acyl carrier protein
VSKSNQGLDNTPCRVHETRATLVDIFSGISGISVGAFASGRTFLELGIDSLSLLQASQSIHQRLGVKVPFRSLLDELSSVDVLAAHLDPRLPGSALSKDLKHAAGASSNGVHAGSTSGIRVNPDTSLSTSALDAGKPGSLEAIAAQLAALSQQLGTFTKTPLNASSNGKPASHGSPVTSPSAWPTSVPSAMESSPRAALNDLQCEHLDRLISALVAKTRESKRRAQAYRAVLADSVVSANFRLPWKEICYPIVAERASGATVCDIDGNEYIDIAMGFGALLFGHSPAFVRDALSAQVERGMRLGLQSDLAGEVAALLCELTGVERVAFCNSGTEAVMTALRVARAVTGRSRIALFAGLYHGTFDGVLAGSIRDSNGSLHTVPRTSGVPAKMLDDVLVLPFGEQESLDILAQEAGELAAVLVEPAPWWNTNVDLREFLHRIRSITSASGSALVFDEVVVGFRMHPGGAQAEYDVRADLVTYGKAVGAGMPIGVIAGSSNYMDAMDGGNWNFGDASSPQADTTLFAGTFFKHPMVMAAAHAVLQHIRQSGPRLQEQLTARTAAMAVELNTYFQYRQIQIQAVQFGSGFSFSFAPECPYTDLFFHHLINHGLYVCDTRKCYLSTAHTDQDVERIVTIIQRCAEEMNRGGFLAASRRAALSISAVAPAVVESDASVPRTYPMTQAQKGLWTLSNISPAACSAYNESINIRFRNPLDVPALRDSFSTLVQRHDALRTTFSSDGAMQRVVPKLAVDLPVVDLSSFEGEAQQTELERWLVHDVEQIFDLEHGPLFRVSLLKLGAEHHVLALTIHHIAVDGWSIDILLRELGALYSAETLGIPGKLPPPVSYSAYATGDNSLASPAYTSPFGKWSAEDERYWLECYDRSVPVVKFTTDRPRPPVQTYTGSRVAHITNADLFCQVKALGDTAGCTPFTTLLALFEVALRDITGQDEMVVGVHLAGQSMLPDAAVFGYCIEMLPLRGKVDAQASFLQHLSTVKERLGDAVEHHAFPVSQLIRELKLRRDPARPPMVAVIFNMDPPALCALGGDGEGDADVTPWWGLSCEFVPNPRVFARFDQVWNVVEQDGCLVIDCTYNTDLFDPSTIQSAVEHFERIIRFYAESPRAKLRQKRLRAHRGKIGGKTERFRVLRRGNGKASPKNLGRAA